MKMLGGSVNAIKKIRPIDPYFLSLVVSAFPITTQRTNICYPYMISTWVCLRKDTPKSNDTNFPLRTAKQIVVNLTQRSLAPRKDDIALCLKSESREEYNECNWARPCPVDLVFTIDGTVSRVGYTTQIFGPYLLMFMHDKL